MSQLTALYRQECEGRGAVIIYATHIFDGLEGWLTHLAFVSQGKLLKGPLVFMLMCISFRKHARHVQQAQLGIYWSNRLLMLGCRCT